MDFILVTVHVHRQSRTPRKRLCRLALGPLQQGHLMNRFSALTMGQAVVQFLAHQFAERDDREGGLFPGDPVKWPDETNFTSKIGEQKKL